jgi:hypothetical protein
MLVEVIRLRQTPAGDAVGSKSDGGLLAGVADSQLAEALRAMHADMGRSWTVTTPAKVAGGPRSPSGSAARRVCRRSTIYSIGGWQPRRMP